MKLKDFVEKLRELSDDYPDACVIYSIDEEGNGFEKVMFDPSPGRYEDGEFDNDNEEINAVCIN